MSGQSPVSPARKLHDADVVYLYDGSFEGFLCCVFESFAQHELPFAVWTPERETATLYPVKEIPTDRATARRSLPASAPSWAKRRNPSSPGIFSRAGRIRSCGSSGFCIWPLRWGQAPSSGGATRRWLRSTR